MPGRAVAGRGTSGRAARSIIGAVAVTALTAGALVVTGAPAAAVGYRYETSDSRAYIDTHRPSKIYIDQPGDVPVGSWEDDRDRLHTARAYYTFDISAYQNARIGSASLFSREASVADCTKRPTVELWRTAAYTAKSSWKKPPADLALLDTTTLPTNAVCPAAYVEWDAVEGVRQALAEGRSTVTFSLRIPAAQQGDPSLSRRYPEQLGLTIGYNHPPSVPTDLVVGHHNTPCDTAEPYTLLPGGDVRFGALATDIDENETGGRDQLTVTFAVWPVDDPAARTERQANFYHHGRRATDFPAGTFQHDRVYAWQARTADPQDSSAWSGVCYFRTDHRGPVAAPSVSSPEFPGDGVMYPGVPGHFTFDANGDQDVVAFRYSLVPGAPVDVPASAPGGSATVVINPRFGPNTLYVESVDRAGNRSPQAEYRFLASDVAPIVNGEVTAIGVPTELTFAPGMPGVVRYRYRLDDQAEQAVTAQPDGTAGVTITVAAGGHHTLSVTSETAAGVAVTRTVDINLPTEPLVSATVYEEYAVSGGQGVPGVFTFTPRMPNVVSYRYLFNETEATVDAAADGTASVTWTPTEAGWTTLVVFSVSADGTESQPAVYPFTVRDLLPSVTSQLYRPDVAQGGPGQPGQFTLRSQVTGVVSFKYRFDGGPEQTVAANPLRTATISHTPTQGGSHTLAVRSVTSAGVVSPERTYSFLVNSAPLVASADYPRDTSSGQAGTPGVFTFAPQLPGVVSYRYTFSGEEERTVDAATDGTASITWTPQNSGWTSLTVHGVTADGTNSDPRQYSFSVREVKPAVTSYLYMEYSPIGGIGVPGAFRFSSELPDTVEFRYRLNGGPEQTVPADGEQAADLTVTPDRGFDNTLVVRSRSASGVLSPEVSFTFVVSTAPEVSSPTYPQDAPGGGVGVPGVFTFTPAMPGVVSYVYQFDNGPEVTVPAAADGTGSVTLTPTNEAMYPLSVQAVDGSGTRSHPRYYWFIVQG